MACNKSMIVSNGLQHTNNVSSLNMNILKSMESKVVAPRNPKLIKTVEVPKTRMAPSEYLHEMSLDTEQKLSATREMRLPKIIELLDMSDTTHQKISYVDIEEAMFQPFPSEIVYQNFEPFKTIEVPLILRNNDKVSRLVKVYQEDSPYFDIINPDDVSHKVAPGMSSLFRIRFTPEDNKDYQHELVCMTEREKFIVPVRAIGARAILDFPDEINFETSPVKHVNSKTLFVRNIGNRIAKYKFQLEKPFTIKSKQSSLDIGDSMQVIIDFEPLKIGSYKRDLLVKYDCDDEIHITLHGEAIDANVRLDRNTIRIEQTFISMANKRTVTLYNRSNVLAFFKFSSYATRQEEQLRKNKYCGDLKDEEEQEKERFFDECTIDPTLRDRLSILTRTFHNRKQMVENDPLVFQDDVFEIVPVEGEVWPNSSMDISIIFRPIIAKLYNKTIFCDVTGRETRLPLKIRGEGIGPRCLLSFDSLDIGDVFASSDHSYEVIMVNKGDIDAIFGLAKATSSQNVDDKFTFNPNEGIILPGGHQAIKINFKSSNLGKIEKRFTFNIDGSNHPLTFMIRGNVVGPTFHFNVQQLVFGRVSFGFIHSKVCTLKNTSLVSMNVVFRVPDDGDGEASVECTSFRSLDGYRQSFVDPQEFSITPAQATIRPQSEITVQISLCSNTVKNYDCELHVDVVGIGASIVTLPILATSVVPNIQLLTPCIDMGRCFVDYSYRTIVKLANNTDLPAKYDLVEQKKDAFTNTHYCSCNPHGIIEANSIVEIPINLQFSEVTKCSENCLFTIFGNTEHNLKVKINALGEGPVVFYNPERIQYGMIQVLTEVVKFVNVANESLISANFTAHMTRDNRMFQVYPNEGTILPNSSVDLQITAFLNDAFKFNDKLLISIEKGQNITINIEATGTGTSIFSNPPLTPSIDLGSHFAGSTCSQTFTLTNRGRRSQALTWTTEGYDPAFRRSTVRKAHQLNRNDMKFRVSASSTLLRLLADPNLLQNQHIKIPDVPVFKITPMRLTLRPRESCVMTLEGSTDKSQQVVETIVCYSVVGRTNGKEKIIKTTAMANFITPVLKISKDHIKFCIDKPSDDSSSLEDQLQHFTVDNISNLPLTCILQTKHPFHLLNRDSKTSSIEIDMDVEEQIAVIVCFDPTYKRDLKSRFINGNVRITFKQHPHHEVVKLSGEVNFPNLQLDKKEINFGCILNDTEVARHVDITNCSPMPLSYRWSFVVEPNQRNITHEKSKIRFRLLQNDCEESVDEDVDVSVEGKDEMKILELVEMAKDEKEVLDEGMMLREDENEDEELKKLAKDEEDIEQVEEIVDQKYQTEETVAGITNHQDADQINEEENKKKRRCLSRISSCHQPSHPNNTNIDDYPLLPWLQAGDNRIPEGVEEVFDILPLYGTLAPGEMQRVTFTYYGHADVTCNAKAVCEVQGGPKYEVKLVGSASLIEYAFDKAEVDFGKQMYNQVSVATLRLENPGRVGFDFEGGAGLGVRVDDNITPGVPVLEPMCGHVDAFSEVVLNIFYFAGVPEKFHKTFQIQVAHFEPTTVTIIGEGVFHRLVLNLPRIVPVEDKKMMCLLEQARQIVERSNQSESVPGSRMEDRRRSERQSVSRASAESDEVRDISGDVKLQMEFERLVIQQVACETPSISSPCLSDAPKKRKRLRISEYILDFGHVVLGTVKSHIVRATNTSSFPFSFKADRSSLFQSGFNVDLDCVQQLPGAPNPETVEFKITFDPRGGNLPVGPVSADMSINIFNGPQINIKLHAVVAVPDMKVSTELVDFEEVQCGQCKIVTFQLHNPEKVPCEWMSLSAMKEIKKKKLTPWVHHNSKKMRVKMKKPKHFELMPDHGLLQPDERINVQLKFMPTEEKFYSYKLTIHVHQAVTRIHITAHGQGLEPRIEFQPPMVAFVPILPHAVGVEETIVVRNPCKFPIEFYSTNFDQQYLNEERILRNVKGYDEYWNVLLPPRVAGEELPPELVSFQQELDEQERTREAENDVTETMSNELVKDESLPEVMDDQSDVDVEIINEILVQHDTELVKIMEEGLEDGNKKRVSNTVGELELDPVSLAMARHVGIDFSAEARAARNRLGIVVILHGPPYTGKTNVAAALSKKYGAVRLNVDSIVLEAISEGVTKAGRRAREICQNAAKTLKMEEENESNAVGGLSVEALNAHTAGEDRSSKLVAPSVISTKRTSLLGKQVPLNKSIVTNDVSLSQMGLQDGTNPIIPTYKRLSVSASVEGEDGLISCLLPDELLIEILADRFQLSDCHHGIIIDGLESLFSSCHQNTLQSLLKAINNRKFIYFITFKLSFETYYNREKIKEEEAAKNIQKQEENHKIMLDDMDEEDYDALPDHIKEKIDQERLEVKRRRIKRETEEKIEKQKLIDLEKVENERRMIEEMRRKGKKIKKEDRKTISGKNTDSDKLLRGTPNRESKMLLGNRKTSVDTVDMRADSRTADVSEVTAEENAAPKKATNHKKMKHRPRSLEEHEEKLGSEEFYLSEEMKAIQKKFSAFDASFKDLDHLLKNWDRTTLDVKWTGCPDEAVQQEEEPKIVRRSTKKERLEKERLEREKLERLERERLEKEKMKAEIQTTAEGSVPFEEEIGIPLLTVDLMTEDKTENVTDKELIKLPSIEEVLEGLGLGTNGPPIPPPVVFSVVPYPVIRKPPKMKDEDRKFEFISSLPQTVEVVDTEADEVAEAAIVKPEKAALPEAPPSSSKKSKRDRDLKSARKNSPASKKHRKNSQEDIKSPPSPSISSIRVPPEEMKLQEKISHYRWVIPAESEIPLKIHFKSETLGQFDQTMEFEITGTRRKYQLFCRGICTFPTISREPRVVFPKRRKARLEPDEIVSKKFLMYENYFEFGPLLCGKTRERYKQKRYIENVESIHITNTSQLQSIITSCFQHDVNATTFILDPPNMVLEPGETKPLSIWAYPKTAGRFHDSVVCCVRENPEPVTFDVACYGVRPEVEIDRKLLQFDKILLHRKDTRVFHIRNITLLPVAWRIAGIENLGDDFTINQESGIIPVRGSFAVKVHFKAAKALIVKKIIRIEVYDVSNIMGLVQTENISIVAEAYDVALDLSFPKGSDGGLEFGTVRVFEESKQVCSLRNKGKYEIAFNFVLDSNVANFNPVDQLFSILPQKGVLIASDRPTQVQVIFKTEKEETLKDLPILKCQVIEPNIGDGKEVIASIPIKLSARSLFSKYEIYPTTDINFGPMFVNTKKSRTLTIVNKGSFEFKYTIVRSTKDLLNGRTRLATDRPNGKKQKSRDGSSSSKWTVVGDQPFDVEPPTASVIVQKNRTTATRSEAGNSGQMRLQLGSFSIYPGVGSIQAGGSQVVTVECAAESLGKNEEFLMVDITDRDVMSDVRDLTYRLMSEGCLPMINTSDMSLVFEEHRFVSNLQLSEVIPEVFDNSGVYSEEENKFSFKNVIVGHRASARFKVSNISKVPVDISINLKAHMAKLRLGEVFGVEPSKAQIQAHDSIPVTVTFHPTTIQQYNCVFEATVDGMSSAITKGRLLTFEISGEGNLPHVTVSRPKILNKKRNPLLVFKRTLLGKSSKMKISLKNEGIFSCQVNLILEEEDIEDQQSMTAFNDNKIFFLAPVEPYQPAYPTLQPNTTGEPPYAASVVVKPEMTCHIDVAFKPLRIGIFNARVRVLIVDNQFEEHSIQLYAESFQDDVTIENLHSEDEVTTFANKSYVVDIDSLRRELTTSTENGGTGLRGELLDFGDCDVGKAKQKTFTLMNHSSRDCYRFKWGNTNAITFRPTLGHLHPGCSKEITVTYVNEKPEVLSRVLVRCELIKIRFQNSNEVVDWDDRMQIIKWVDVGKEERKSTSSSQLRRAAKKKVYETEVEPVHLTLESSTTVLELLVSARANYSKYTCDTTSINFKDTLMLQTRVYNFRVVNSGEAKLGYSWHFTNDQQSGKMNRSIDEVRSPPITPFTASNSVQLFNPLISSPISARDLDKTFSISPSSGTILAKKSQQFEVRFSPESVDDFNSWLICHMPNVNSNQDLAIKLKGRSLLPHCHFDFEDSDFLTTSNEGLEFTESSLESQARCFEINSIGVNVKNQKKFWIMNPTDESYVFEWICTDDVELEDVRPSFVCDTLSSELVSGKKLLMTFTFLPRKLGRAQSWWKFHIAKKNISIPFLLIGNCREPNVFFNLSHFLMKPVLVGRQVNESISLINKESIGINFSVKPSSCHADASASSLVISPMEGYIEPNSQFKITLTYAPRVTAEANFNILVAVSRKSKLLSMNIKTISYFMDVKLFCENSKGNRIELSSIGVNSINLGEVQLFEKCIRKMHLMNSGSYTFNYTWKLVQGSNVIQQNVVQGQPSDDETKLTTVSVQPNSGEVSCGEHKIVDLIFQPNKVGKLTKTEMIMEVTDGPSFSCLINGTGVTPGVEFSFLKYNFDCCFIYKAGMPYNQAILKLFNRGKNDVSVECLYNNTDFLEVIAPPLILESGEGTSFYLRFYPREVTTYRELVPFKLNGLSTQTVEIRGEGAKMKVEVYSPSQKLIRFGALRVGKKVKHVVPIVNRSSRSISMNLSINPLNSHLQEQGVLKILPYGTIELAGKGGKRDVEVYFHPQKRTEAFTEEVMMECAGLSQPIFIITGSCQGIDIRLEQDSVPFGAVVQHSVATRRFAMKNAGDIGASFRWEVNKFKPDYSITPGKGYISPGMEIPFQVQFHPVQPSPDIRYENLRCLIENHEPLFLTLTGMCVSAPLLKEILNFSCLTRGRDTRNIVMNNRSNQRWVLKPVVEGNYFSGAETFTVEAGQNKTFEIEYKPLAMTTEGKKHQGSIFFPLPDGNGLLYNLLGVSDPPKPAGFISRDIPCKTPYTEALPVANWLRTPQRFKVTIEMIKPEKLDASTTLNGMDYIDVPGGIEKKYKLKFFAHKEGAFAAKIYFKNEKTGEFLFYIVTLRATSAGTISTIELETAVRKTTSHTINIENPLSTGVTFYTECKLPEISVPLQIVIPANSLGTCTFEYQPLKVGETSSKILLVCQELGYYIYELNLKARPCGEEKTTYFQSQIGHSQVITIKFQNHARQRTEYSCKISSNMFSSEKSLTTAPASSGAGTEVTFDVTYEPTRLGEKAATLTLSSPVGGDYIFPLIGKCIQSKPQGPYSVKKGSTIQIPFKNVFTTAVTFSFRVDNLFFQTKAQETIRSKKSQNIQVSFDGKLAPGSIHTAMLTVVSGGPNIPEQSWVFYLKGIVPDSIQQ